LSGTPDEITAVAAAQGVVIQKEIVGGATGYLVNHSARLIVIDREGRVRLMFPFGVTSQAMAGDLRYLLER
jgi:protein SCO1/2